MQTPTKTTAKPRLRLHMSPALLEEMDSLRLTRGHRSWDDFFRSLLAKPAPSPAPIPMDKLENLDTKVGVALKFLAELREELETSGALHESLHASVDEFTRAVHGIHRLLAMALNVPDEPEGRQKSTASNTEKTGGISPETLARLRRRG